MEGSKIKKGLRLSTGPRNVLGRLSGTYQEKRKMLVITSISKKKKFLIKFNVYNYN